jgi:hypothetical protein
MPDPHTAPGGADDVVRIVVRRDERGWLWECLGRGSMLGHSDYWRVAVNDAMHHVGRAESPDTRIVIDVEAGE